MFRRTRNTLVCLFMALVAIDFFAALVLAGDNTSSGTAQTYPSCLSVYFLDVEQGNCVLIVSPSSTAALIDAGSWPSGDAPSDDAPVNFIQGLMDTDVTFNLQYVIATHYDADHIGKLDEVLNAGLLAPNGTVFDRGDVSSTKDAYLTYRTSIGSHRRAALQPGMEINLGCNAVLTCVAVNGSYLAGGKIVAVQTAGLDENGLSAAFILSYGNAKLWFGGDLTGEVESALAPFVPDIDVYAVDHHGSTTSSSLTLLQHLRPEFAIVQSGQTNTYGHPNKKVIQRILSVTDSQGDAPKVIYQNHAKPGDSRSDDGLAYAIADPDGMGPMPGRISITTDGEGPLIVTIMSG